MMFVIRSGDAKMDAFPPGLAVKMTRRTPELVADGRTTTDFFCVGDPAAARAAGLNVVAVHDGWYRDDADGGVAIWGQGKYWEVRDTHFSVKEAVGADAAAPAKTPDGETVDVRRAIFGA